MFDDEYTPDEEWPDLEGMSQEELKTCLEDALDQLDQLDAEEPTDMMSPEYDVWGDRRENLEDLVDDILDLLEEEE